jgi:hypothetical protein
MKMKPWGYQDAADAGDQGGAGGAAAAADAGKGGAAADAGAGGKGDPTLLAQGGDAAAQAAAASAAAGDKGKLKEDPNAWLPERFRVKKDGADELDTEASAKKVAEAYGQLEKRMKDTGLPPESPEKYEFKPAAGMEKLQLDAERSTAAKKGLHALGLTQKQYQGVMEMYVGELNTIVERGTEMGAAKAAETLEGVWGKRDEPAFKANLALANKAFHAFADDADKAELDRIGNHPVILKILAKVGRELREDQVAAGQILSGESLDQLMKDPAYFNVNDPRHAEVVGKAQRHFQAQADAEARKQAA